MDSAPDILPDPSRAADPARPQASSSRWARLSWPSGTLKGGTLIWGLVVATVCIVARAPTLLLQPRFWAEDATVYFAYARLHGLWESLLLVPTTAGPAGYLNLAANGPAWLAARMMPLEWAPLVPTLFALAIQLLPIALVLRGLCAFLESQGERLVAAAVLLISPALVSEVWLTTASSQIFLGLAAFLISTEDPARMGPRGFRLRLGLVALAGLSGPYTTFLIPFFLWRAFTPKTAVRPSPTALRRARGLAAVAGAAAVVQGALYLWTVHALGLTSRGFGGGPLGARLAAILHGNLLQAWFGASAGTEAAGQLGLLPLIASLGPNGAQNLDPAHLRSGGWISLGILVIVACLLAWPMRGKRAPALAALWTSLAVGLAVGPLVTVERYGVLPGLLWTLALLPLAFSASTPVPRWLARLLLAGALLMGLLGYFDEHPASSLGRHEGRPSWAEEVRSWRQDPTHLLAIWPYSEPQPWHLFLPREGAAPVPALRTERPVRLVSTGRWSRKVWRVDGLEGDFKLVLRSLVSASPGETRLRLGLLDAEGRSLATFGPGRFPAEQVFRWQIDRDDTKLGGIEIDRVRYLMLAFRSTVDRPARVVIQDLYLAPRVEGTLEALLPTAPVSRLVGHSEPILGEASVRAKLRRLLPASKTSPPKALRSPSRVGPIEADNGLPSSEEGHLAESWAHAAFTTPFAWVLGPGGAVVFGWLLLGALVVRIRFQTSSLSPGATAESPMDDPDQGPGQIPKATPLNRLGWAQASSFIAVSAAAIYLFVPGPEPLWMVLLFGSIGSWLHETRVGGPAMRSNLGPIAAAAALGLTAAELPTVWPLAVLPGIWWLAQKRFARVGLFVAGLALGFCAAWGLTAAVGGELTGLSPWTTSTLDSSVGETASLLQRAFGLVFGRYGWLGLFPFALLALLRFAGGRDDAKRLALFGAILAVNLSLLFSNAAFDHPSLAWSTLAAIYPLFSLLPTPRLRTAPVSPSEPYLSVIGGRKGVERIGLLLACLAFFILTLPTLERLGGKPAQEPGSLEVREVSEPFDFSRLHASSSPGRTQ